MMPAHYEAGDYDFLVAVVFEANWDIRCGAQISHADLHGFPKFRDHVNRHTMRMAPSVFSDPRVKDISDRLRG